MSGSLIQIENRKTLWTVSTPACVSWVCVDGSSARKPGNHNLPVDSAVKGVKRVNFWDTKILQLTRYRMSLSKILAHLRQSWYTLGDNNYYNVNNNNNNNSIKHLSRLFLSHGSRVIICIILDWFDAFWSSRYSCRQLCCYEGSASTHPLYFCVFVSDLSCVFCVNECLNWVRIFLDDQCWSTLRGGSGPRGRRFRCCLRFPWQSSVVLMPRALLPSTAFWLLAAACPQLSPRSCPSLQTAWAWIASLAQMMEAACFHPEEIMSRGKRSKVWCGFSWKHNLLWY